MTVASPVFKALLKGKFREAEEMRTKGFGRIDLLDDDPEAFEILLNLIHLNHAVIPVKVDLCLLVHLAILVDKYDLYKSTHIIKDIWIDNLLLEERIPIDSSRDLFAWIGILRIFKRPREFTISTRVAITMTPITGWNAFRDLHHFISFERLPQIPPVPESVIGI
jgi:hypothetical protein